MTITPWGSCLPRVVAAADGSLGQFNQAGVLDAADVHVATTLGTLGGEGDERVLLAAALVVRALRSGSVCLPLRESREFAARLERADDAPDVATLPWPEIDGWLDAVSRSSLVGSGDTATSPPRPLVLHGGQLYLERDWEDQETVRRVLRSRWLRKPPHVDEAVLSSFLEQAMDPTADAPIENAMGTMRDAIRTVAHGWTTIVAGGPGTGKTTLVSSLLDALARQSAAAGTVQRVALAAPTGKAAARLSQLAQPDGMAAVCGTLHRVLGSRGPGRGFRYGPLNPLPFDLVVVDEVSMVSLAMMARLVSALPDSARLVLVGDPDQLSSVDAGAVLADLVAASMTLTRGSDRPSTVTMTHTWRFSGALAQLADAIRRGDAGRTIDVLTSGDDAITFDVGDPGAMRLDMLPRLCEQIVEQAKLVTEAAVRGAAADALRALDEHRLLCAHREGPYGASDWGRSAERLARVAVPVSALASPWYPGRTVLMTVNQPQVRASNGDQGVVIATGNGLRVAFGDPDEPNLVPVSALQGLQPLYAMTVHKAQGSQYGAVTLVVPPESSPLLTRQLLYTAVTRARHRLRVIGSIDSIRQAVTTPAWRASGLADRLHDEDDAISEDG